MAETVPFKYRAFLSYSHRDTGWAKWLHARLESFRIDKDLIGRETPVGPVPKTLRPIFRDREDFSGGHTLTDATVAALDASAALIVLCSTVSAGRPAVNEEVRLFRSRHPERPVIPVIIEGTCAGQLSAGAALRARRRRHHHRPPRHHPRPRSARKRRRQEPRPRQDRRRPHRARRRRRLPPRRAGAAAAHADLARGRGLLLPARGRGERQRCLCLAATEDQRGLPQRHAQNRDRYRRHGGSPGRQIQRAARRNA